MNNPTFILSHNDAVIVEQLCHVFALSKEQRKTLEQLDTERLTRIWNEAFAMLETKGV